MTTLPPGFTAATLSVEAGFTITTMVATTDSKLLVGGVTSAGGGTTLYLVSAPANTQVVTLSLLGMELAKGPYGQSYGPGRSGWTSVPRNSQLLLRLPG